MNITTLCRFSALSLAATLFHVSASAAPVSASEMDTIIKPLMQQYQIPGMAIAVSAGGETRYYNYGVASKQDNQPVTPQTLFEIGSLSKTFTATLASYAQQQGKIDFDAPVTRYLPTLKGSAFDHITLQNLATHTTGLPLQVPDAINSEAQLMTWYRHWQPPFVAGSQRVYSNPGIGLLGLISARQLKLPFSDLMQQRLLPALGMKHSWVQVPQAEMASYAQGYDKDNRPVRVNPGMLDAEAYGIKSSSADLIRFLNINMGEVKVDKAWQDAVQATHNGYYQVGDFVQNVMWESYRWPVTLPRLLAGNDSRIIIQPQAVTPLKPALPPQRDALYNKTGSTNGFSTYALFIPARGVAVILLANKYYPNTARVDSAWKIIEALKQ